MSHTIDDWFRASRCEPLPNRRDQFLPKEIPRLAVKAVGHRLELSNCALHDADGSLGRSQILAQTFQPLRYVAHWRSPKIVSGERQPSPSAGTSARSPLFSAMLPPASPIPNSDSCYSNVPRTNSPKQVGKIRRFVEADTNIGAKVARFAAPPRDLAPPSAPLRSWPQRAENLPIMQAYAPACKRSISRASDVCRPRAITSCSPIELSWRPRSGFDRTDSSQSIMFASSRLALSR